GLLVLAGSLGLPPCFGMRHVVEDDPGLSRHDRRCHVVADPAFFLEVELSPHREEGIARLLESEESVAACPFRVGTVRMHKCAKHGFSPGLLNTFAICFQPPTGGIGAPDISAWNISRVNHQSCTST